MPDLLLPERVVREIQKDKWAEERKERRAKLAALFDFEDRVCQEWNPLLRDLDPLLRLGRARPLAYEPGWNVTPNYYHWIRDNENAPVTITPITGPDGESFREPDSGVLQDLRESDLQNPVIFAMLLERRKAREEAAKQEKERDREERQQEIVGRYLAGSRVGVSMSDATPWTQNSAGKRGGKA